MSPGENFQMPANDAVSSFGQPQTGFLSLFAVPLGIAGLGGVWQTSRSTFSAPPWPAEVLFAISTAIWLLLSLTYFAGRARSRATFSDDREHAIYGPFAAYVPVIGILLASHYENYSHRGGQVAVAVFVVGLAVLDAQLLAHWLLGNLPLSTFHPGYFLPTVAGAFIASIGLGQSGWHPAAQGAFGVGAFFWLVMGTLIFGRLFTGVPLPDPMKPSMFILVSPPATAGIAWFLLSAGKVDIITNMLMGVLAIMLLVQVLFFAEYRGIPFSTNFWAFSFPVAASANLISRWLAATQDAVWDGWYWALAGFATVVVLVIAAATLVDATKRRAAARRHRPVPSAFGP